MTMHRVVIAGAVALLGVACLAAPAAAQQAGQARTPAATSRDTSAIEFRREVFSYRASGRRDPFASLISTGDIRPLFSDLLVAGIVYDPTGRNSVAMLQDVSTGELYRARVGSVFGRLRVTSIREKQVGVAIDEFGFTRQETLSLNIPVPGERTP